MLNTTPFSYHLYHIPTGKHYYGIRYARGCSPEELWTTYFSTSKIVKQLITEYGKDSFKFEIRRIFCDYIAAIAWEHKVLRRLNAAESEKWLNRHNGSNKFRPPLHHSDETKEIIRKKISGTKRSQITKDKHKINAINREFKKRESGWKMPPESIEKSIITRQERINNGSINPYTDERKAKIAAARKGTKRLYLPDGSFTYIKS